MAKVRIWRCACGKEYVVDGRPINCIGKGHSVTIMPAYFKDEEKKTETPKNDKDQYALF